MDGVHIWLVHRIPACSRFAGESQRLGAVYRIRGRFLPLTSPESVRVWSLEKSIFRSVLPQ